MKEYINSDIPEEFIKNIAFEIGKSIGKLHVYGIALDLVYNDFP